MALRRPTTTIVSLFVLALATSFSGDAANAQTLFETLFGGGPKKVRTKDFPPPPPKKRAIASGAAVAKITGPGYNTYRADRLVKVDFSRLAATPVPVSLQPGSAQVAFDEALAGLADYELLAEKDIAAALTAYYSENRSLIWVNDGAPNERSVDALRVLGEASGYGLDPADYLVAVPQSTSTSPETRRADLVRFEMVLSARVLRYVRDATGGRVDPNRITGYYDFPAKQVDLNEALRAMSQASDIRGYLEGKHPQNHEYKALRVELEALEGMDDDTVVVDPKLLLKPGESNPELPKLLGLIAKNLDDEMGGEYGEALYRLGKSETYSDELVPVIKAVQKRAGLADDGVLGPRTVNALAGTSKADKVAKVQVALEQLRWLPSDLGATRVFVNQPAFMATYIEDGIEKLATRVVVGAPSTQTSFFFDEIEQVDYNPYWGVPQSIIVNEMLPRLRSDPGYLDRAGYEVFDAKGRRIASSSVNWGAYGSKVPYGVRQTPSEANALGELKILFPNKHAIYMHDTPQKKLFERDSRAFSHGCIRLQDPRGMAAAVLGKPVDHVIAKLAEGHSSEKVSRKIPVYVAYFTAWPTPSGNVEYFADVYDRDSRLKLAIDSTEAVRRPGS
jgi:murein L,D-transpeptidase YcbB/YkuD